MTTLTREPGGFPTLRARTNLTVIIWFDNLNVISCALFTLLFPPPPCSGDSFSLPSHLVKLMIGNSHKTVCCALGFLLHELNQAPSYTSRVAPNTHTSVHLAVWRVEFIYILQGKGEEWGCVGMGACMHWAGPRTLLLVGWAQAAARNKVAGQSHLQKLVHRLLR